MLAIVGFGAAARAAIHGLDERAATQARQRDLLWQLLSANIPQTRRNGPTDAPCLPNTLNVSFAGCAGESLLVRLKRRLGLDQLAPMHRLDRETAGLMLFSVQPATRARYAQMFAARAVEKRYEAVALLNTPLHSPEARAPVMPTLRRSRIVGAAPGKEIADCHD